MMENPLPLDGTNDLEVLKKMEDEHCRLQRQFRTIQTDRLHRTMGVHPQFRRQDELMRTLKKEYLNILKDLKIAKSGTHKIKRERLETNLQTAILHRIQTETKCDEGVTVMEQLEGVLQRKSKELLLLRKLSTANQGQIQKRREQSEYRLVSTENKLETAMLRFNAVQCENQKIREEIEHMMKDRSLFNQGWTKMLGALNKGKKFLTDLFESSTLAYDQRDELCTKLRSVQEKGKMDQMQQVQEMRDLQKAFDHDMKLYHFLARKGVVRINLKQKEREEDMKKKQEEDINRQYAEHVKILNGIYDYTNEYDENNIIANFSLIEHRNFSIYMLVTDFCAENIVLQRNLASIRQQLEDRRDYNEMRDLKTVESLKTMTEDLENKRKTTDALRDQLADRQQTLNATMDHVNEMFRMLDCSLEPFQNLLGDKQPTLHQLDLSLKLITDKIKEHIETVYYYEHCTHMKREKASSSRLKKYTVRAEPPAYNWTATPINVLVPADPCPACIETRWMSRVSETLELPFDRQMALEAIASLIAEPAYLRSDRIHPITECRVPRSRAILARRYMNY